MCNVTTEDKLVNKSHLYIEPFSSRLESEAVI